MGRKVLEGWGIGAKGVMDDGPSSQRMYGCALCLYAWMRYG